MKKVKFTECNAVIKRFYLTGLQLPLSNPAVHWRNVVQSLAEPSLAIAKCKQCKHWTGPIRGRNAAFAGTEKHKATARAEELKISKFLPATAAFMESSVSCYSMLAPGWETMLSVTDNPGYRECKSGSVFSCDTLVWSPGAGSLHANLR